MSSCKTCKHSIYCETWGEYKCAVKKLANSTRFETNCTDYKLKKATDPQILCSCEDCENNKGE